MRNFNLLRVTLDIEKEVPYGGRHTGSCVKRQEYISVARKYVDC